MEEFLIVYDESKEVLAKSISSIMKVKATPLKYTRDEFGRPRVKVNVGEASNFLYLGGIVPPYEPNLVKTSLALSTLADRGVVEAALISPLPYHKGNDPATIGGFRQCARVFSEIKRFITVDLLPPEKLGYFKVQSISLSAFPVLASYVRTKWGSAEVLTFDEDLRAAVEAMKVNLEEGSIKLIIDTEVWSIEPLVKRLKNIKGDAFFFSTHFLVDPSPLRKYAKEVMTTDLVFWKDVRMLGMAPMLVDYLRTI
jgi:phosphoribosylpyrophosphate synthetase